MGASGVEWANETTIVDKDGPLYGESGVKRANEMTIMEWERAELSG